jgi:hypothetical protein
MNGYLMRSLLVTTVVACTVAAVLFLGGCTDATPTGSSNNDATTITGVYYIQAKINGKTETMQEQQQGNTFTGEHYQGQYGGSSGVDEYSVIQESGFERETLVGTDFVDDPTFHSIWIGLIKVYDHLYKPTDDELDLLLPSTAKVDGSADDYKDGVEIRWTDAAGTEWSSAWGVADQAGSNFTVTSKVVNDEKPPYVLGPLYKVKGTFNCKLYDGKGNSIDVTDGKFHLRMVHDL